MSDDRLWNGTMIVLLINAAAALLWTVILLIAPETLMPLIYGEHQQSIVRDRQLGMLFLASAIVSLWSLKKNKWKPLKHFLLFLIIGLLGNCALGVADIVILGPSAGGIVTLILTTILPAINILAYFKEESIRKQAK